THHRFDVHRNSLFHAAAAEREYLIDQRTSTLAGGNDAIQITTQPRALFRVAYRHLAVAEDHAEDVVEVVRNAARQCADGLESLRATQRLLHAAQVFFGLVAFGDVEHEAVRADRLALRVEECAALLVEPAHRPVGVDHAVLDVDLAAGERARNRVFHDDAVVRVAEAPPPILGAVEGLGRYAEHGRQLGRPAVRLRRRAVVPFPWHGTRGLLRDFKHLVARAQLGLDAFALGDVFDRARHAVRLARGVTQCDTSLAQPPDLAIT